MGSRIANPHGGNWPDIQAHTHAGTGGHIYQGIEAENLDFAFELSCTPSPANFRTDKHPTLAPSEDR